MDILWLVLKKDSYDTTISYGHVIKRKRYCGNFYIGDVRQKDIKVSFKIENEKYLYRKKI